MEDKWKKRVKQAILQQNRAGIAGYGMFFATMSAHINIWVI